jgi:heme/copper-type cytochrome/quinol oxidase subunit 2
MDFLYIGAEIKTLLCRRVKNQAKKHRNQHTAQKTEKKHKTKVKESAKNYYWIVILLCILISGIAVFFVFRFKKHKK